AGPDIATLFFKPEWSNGVLADVQAFEVHAHRILVFDGDRRANIWMRVMSRQYHDGTAYDQVAVQQDINTLAEERGHTRFEASRLPGLFADLVEQLQRDFATYFAAPGLG